MVPTAIDVRKHGAVGDGNTLDTKAIQAAIDACAARGGVVHFPPGRYLTASIRLRSNVGLHIGQGAAIVGNPKPEHYLLEPDEDMAGTKWGGGAHGTLTKVIGWHHALIRAVEVENVTISGEGEIDGQGGSYPKPEDGKHLPRPQLISIAGSQNVSIRDVLLRDSTQWVLRLSLCKDVDVRGITIRSRCRLNNDGIDINSCENVRVSDCDISCSDDAIVFKSLYPQPTRRCTVTNCLISTDCNAIKFGTESYGGFQHITVSNCTLYDTKLGGLALEIVDGGLMDQITISNITMENVAGPVFLRLGDRRRRVEGVLEPKPAGVLRNVMISNVQARGAAAVGCAISGLPGHPIEGVALENIRLSFTGGGTLEHMHREVGEYPDKYPEFDMFQEGWDPVVPQPSYGFFCRHVRGLKMSNVKLGFESDDHRPAIVCHDVEDLDILGLDAMTMPDSECAIWLRDVRDAMIHGCRGRRGSKTFALLTGCENIHVMANDLSAAAEAVKGSDGE